jgi:hypothetical protein
LMGRAIGVEFSVLAHSWVGQDHQTGVGRNRSEARRTGVCRTRSLLFLVLYTGCRVISYRPLRRRVCNPSPCFLPSETPSQEWVAYERRASDVLCRACSDALSRGGAFLLRPEWTSHRLRDVRVRGVKNVDFDFEFCPCLKVRGIREEDLARAEMPRLHEARREGARALDARV